MTFSIFFHSELPWFLLIGILAFILVILEWIENGHGLKVLSMQEAIRLLNDKRACHFDLRKTEEFNKNHIKGTQNLDKETLLKNPDTFIKKKDQAILLICEHNYQATQAGKILKKIGYTNIHILKGGLSTWRKENLPLEIKNG